MVNYLSSVLETNCQASLPPVDNCTDIVPTVAVEVDVAAEVVLASEAAIVAATPSPVAAAIQSPIRCCCYHSTKALPLQFFYFFY